MNYLIKIEIADSVDEVTRKRIQKNLVKDTIELAFFPRVKMPIGLIDGSRLIVEGVLPLQKSESGKSADAIAVVKPLESSLL